MNHPYSKFENTALWKTIDDTLSELEQNQDVQITTAREYVVGYLCKQLVHQKLVAKSSVASK